MIHANSSQPAPTPGTGPAIWDLVIVDVEGWGCFPAGFAEACRARDALGSDPKHYGVRLRVGNGRDMRRDLVEELLDATVYARQVAEHSRSHDDLILYEDILLLAGRAFSLHCEVAP